MKYSETETTRRGTPVSVAETSGPSADAPTKSRIMGVDAARGLAVLGMVAAHVFPGFGETSDGTPSIPNMITHGRSIATFALVAGISLAFMTGGRHPVEGRARTAAAAGLAVRALLIGFIGLALGYTGESLSIVLAFYGVLFLLAIPLIGLRPRVLAGLAFVIALVMPVFTLVIEPYIPSAIDTNPTFQSLLQPYQLAVTLLINGDYPALVFMAYICAGLAIGRLNLSSLRVAARLLGSGLALAIIAWVTSEVLLLHLGGLQQLRAAALQEGTPPNQLTDTALLWSLPTTASWWWLAVRAPLSETPIDLLHTIGVAVAVVGAMLLLTRVAAPVLKPLAAVGSMVLTIYSIHVVYMAFDPLGDYPFISYVVQVTAALVFAVIWQRFIGRGPLETVLAVASGRVRRAAAAGGARRLVPLGELPLLRR